MMVKVGQVYRDKDKRMSNRYVLVAGHAYVPRGGKVICVPCRPNGERFYAGMSFATRHKPENLEKRFELMKDV